MGNGVTVSLTSIPNISVYPYDYTCTLLYFKNITNLCCLLLPVSYPVNHALKVGQGELMFKQLYSYSYVHKYYYMSTDKNDYVIIFQKNI